MGNNESGLTPVDTTVKGIRTIDRYKRRKRRYQARERFHGFTADELDKMEAAAHFSTKNMQSALQNNAIHPLFQKTSWVSPSHPYLFQTPDFPMIGMLQAAAHEVIIISNHQILERFYYLGGQSEICLSRWISSCTLL